MDEENGSKPQQNDENCIVLESDDESNDDVVFVSESPAVVDVTNDDDIIFVSKTEAPTGTATKGNQTLDQAQGDATSNNDSALVADASPPQSSNNKSNDRKRKTHKKSFLDLSLSSDSDSDDGDSKFLPSLSPSSGIASPDLSPSSASSLSGPFFSDSSSSDDSSIDTPSSISNSVSLSGNNGSLYTVMPMSPTVVAVSNTAPNLPSSSSMLTLDSITQAPNITNSCLVTPLLPIPSAPMVNNLLSSDISQSSIVNGLLTMDPMLSSTMINTSKSQTVVSKSNSIFDSSPSGINAFIGSGDLLANTSQLSSMSQNRSTSDNVITIIPQISATDRLAVPMSSGVSSALTLQPATVSKVSYPSSCVSCVPTSSNSITVVSTARCTTSPVESKYDKSLVKAIQRQAIKRSTSCGPFLPNMTDESSVPIKKRHSVVKKNTSFSSSSDTAMDLSATTTASKKTVRSSSCADLDTLAGGMHSCSQCKQGVPYENVSRCLQGHVCCGSCLQTSAKLLLAKSKKGSLKCSYQGCEALFSMDQLQRTLPSMVVEILEEKLDQEYIKYSVDLMWEGLVGDETKKESSSDEEVTIVDADRERNENPDKNKSDKLLTGLPSHWEPMEQNTGYKLVELNSEDVEYLELAIMFHTTMFYPRANITKICRVQNPILYQFYNVKKLQMQAENGSQQVLEKQLFHGTSQYVVDGICKTNFDWRRCGVHGTMYGQGSYFARDASYSHMYTDRPSRSRSLSILQQLHTNNNNLGISPWLPIGTPPMLGPGGRRAQSQHLVTRLNALVSLTSGVGVQWGVPANQSVLPPQPSTSRDTEKPEKSNHVMFLSRVLVGQYTQGRSQMRKPPPLDPTNPYGKCFDTCVDNVNEPKIYVVFDSSQCLPEYIIEYTNEIRT